MNLTSILEKFGLNQKEASVYLAALELGSASVQKIAEKAGVVRSTGYEVLESLRNKGLVSTYLKKHARHYSAEDPNQVVRLAQGRLKTLSDALPELNALAGKARGRPAVRFYQGKEGMGLILDEVANEAGQISAFSATQDFFKELGNYHKKFLAKRIKAKIPVRVIINDSPLARERQKLGPRELRTVKIVPNTYEFHGITYIWKNKIAMFSFTNDFVAVVIESKELAQMQLALFNNLWDKV